MWSISRGIAAGHSVDKIDCTYTVSGDNGMGVIMVKVMADKYYQVSNTFLSHIKVVV